MQVTTEVEQRTVKLLDSKGHCLQLHPQPGWAVQVQIYWGLGRGLVRLLLSYSNSEATHALSPHRIYSTAQSPCWRSTMSSNWCFCFQTHVTRKPGSQWGHATGSTRLTPQVCAVPSFTANELAETETNLGWKTKSFHRMCRRRIGFSWGAVRKVVLWKQNRPAAASTDQPCPNGKTLLHTVTQHHQLLVLLKWSENIELPTHKHWAHLLSLN